MIRRIVAQVEAIFLQQPNGADVLGNPNVSRRGKPGIARLGGQPTARHQAGAEHQIGEGLTERHVAIELDGDLKAVGVRTVNRRPFVAARLLFQFHRIGDLR